MSSTPIQKFKSLIEETVADNSFIKISLGNYKGADAQLKNIYVRRIQIKREEKLSFTFRYKTRDVVKNYTISEGIALLEKEVLNGFAFTTLFTTTCDLSLSRLSGDDYELKSKPASLTAQPSSAHNKEKKRLVTADAEKSYLHALRITDSQGTVFKNAQEKYKQINQYIELLSPMLKNLGKSDLKQVVDMGSGKGYLTFALYDYLHNVLKLDTQVTGVEFRKDLVDLCNNIASDAGFGQLNFVEGSIQDYETQEMDLLIALHACDTATDDAIFKGINAGARLIVVAPCCHKQIRKEINSGKKKNELDFLLKHGIFLERQAEMVTDGIRALIMEHFGYKTKIMEFNSDVHTPKNILVVGVKQKETEVEKAAVLAKIKEIKGYFGIGYHHLERLFGLDI